MSRQLGEPRLHASCHESPVSLQLFWSFLFGLWRRGTRIFWRNNAEPCQRSYDAQRSGTTTSITRVHNFISYLVSLVAGSNCNLVVSIQRRQRLVLLSSFHTCRSGAAFEVYAEGAESVRSLRHENRLQPQKLIKQGQILLVVARKSCSSPFRHRPKAIATPTSGDTPHWL